MGLRFFGGSSLPLLTGRAVGGFSSSNKVQSTGTGNQIDFRPGKTLILVLQVTANTGASTEAIIGSQDPSTFAGWTIRRQGGTSTLFLIQGNLASFVAMMTPGNGVHTIALVWRASDSHVLACLDGQPVTDYGAVTAPAAASTSWLSSIGTPVTGDGQAVLASSNVVAFTVLPSELTSAQALAATYTSGNRFTLPAALTSAATVDWNAGRDWDGTSAASTTKGSAPITYTVSGSPSWVRCDEYRILASPASQFDAAMSVQTTDANGNSLTVTDSYGHLQIITDAPTVAVETESTTAGVLGTAVAEIGLYVGGSYQSKINLANDSTPQIQHFQPGATLFKRVDLWGGPNILVTSSPLVYGGTPVIAARVPAYLTDGLTNSNTYALKPHPPQKRMVLFGDSILAGLQVTNFTQSSVTSLLRADFPTSGTGRVTCMCTGSLSVGNVASTAQLVAATVAQLVAALDGTQTNYLWLGLGTNDYGAQPISTANFQSYYAALLDALHAASPSTIVYCQSPIQRISPSTEAANGLGFTLGNYRTAISTVVSTRTAYATYVEGAAAALVSNAHMFTDGIHLDAAGNGCADLKGAIKMTIGY